MAHLLKTNLKSSTRQANIYSYIVVGEETVLVKDGYIKVKIGWTGDEVWKRIKQQKTGISGKIEMVGEWNNLQIIKSDHDVHKILKRRGLWIQEASGTEWFKIPANNIEEAFDYIDNIITELENRKIRKSLTLRLIQDRKFQKVLQIIKKALNQKQKRINVVANLCARFGKTPWALYIFSQLIEEHGYDIMLVPAYWLGVHSSFENEIDEYADFNLMTEINVDDADAEQQAKNSLKQGLKIVVPISLCGSDLESWKAKHKWVSEFTDKKIFCFFDEGDFGTHTDNQKTKIEYLIDNDVNEYINIFASGTNIQRLAKCTRKIDGVVYATYSELEQTDPSVVRRQFYGTNVAALKAEVEATIQAEMMATWSKVWNKPMANRMFIEELFVSFVGGSSTRSELNLSNITGDDINVFMVFTSANIKPMQDVARIIRSTSNNELRQYDVVVLNSENTSNLKANNETETAINIARNNKKKGVIIITNNMGSRSYTAPEIQATVLAFDRGSVDAATQKSSRCLSPTNDKRKLYNGGDKQLGYIIDLSFDPNRNENLEKIVIDESVQNIRSDNGDDIIKATRFFFNSVNMFRVNSFGYPEQITESDMFKIYSDNETLLRVADVSIDVDAITDELLGKMFDFQDITKSNQKSASAIAKAKTIIKRNKQKSSSNVNDEIATKQEIINRACQAINASATNVGLIVDGESYRDCINNIKIDQSLNEIFIDRVGVDAQTIIEILDAGVFPNEPILDCIVQNTRREQPSMNWFT